MRYTVTCSPELYDKLALIYLQSSEPQAVSQASNEIDHLLLTSPLSQSVNHGAYYTTTIEPLTVVFKFTPDDCMVTILDFIYQG